MRVLVIDDQAPVRTSVCDVLRELGVGTIVEASNGRRALALVAEPETCFDLILCDLRMPEHDGIEALRAFAALGIEAAVVIMSVEEDRVIEIAGTLASLQGLHLLGTVRKPVTVENLAPLLHRVFAERPAVWANAASAPEDEIGDAFLRRELEMFYQPQVDARSRRLVGVEALIRWKHPTLGLFQPAAFIPAMERSDNYSVLLTDFSLAEGIAFAGRAQRGHSPLSVSINLSARAFDQLDLPERVDAVARQAGVPPSAITLEITETEVARNLVRLVDVAMRLRLKGFHLSVDDFGTGESGLALLQRVPFTELKIDRQFAHGCAQSTLKRSVVEASVALARRLNMTSVAEGVQNQEDLDLFTALECDRIQGFIFARPMQEDALFAWAAQFGGRTSATAERRVGAPGSDHPST